MEWVKEAFTDKWHAAPDRMTKKALCGFKTAGSSVWTGGRRQWVDGRWESVRVFDDNPGEFACARCRRSLDKRGA